MSHKVSRGCRRQSQQGSPRPTPGGAGRTETAPLPALDYGPRTLGATGPLWTKIGLAVLSPQHALGDAL